LKTGVTDIITAETICPDNIHTVADPAAFRRLLRTQLAFNIY